MIEIHSIKYFHHAIQDRPWDAHALSSKSDEV